MGAMEEEEGAEARRENGASKQPITHAQFLSWKRQKDADAAAKQAEAARKRSEDIAAGRVQMNGRELFLHEPWVFDDSRFGAI